MPWPAARPRVHPANEGHGMVPCLGRAGSIRPLPQVCSPGTSTCCSEPLTHQDGLFSQSPFHKRTIKTNLSHSIPESPSLHLLVALPRAVVGWLNFQEDPVVPMAIPKESLSGSAAGLSPAGTLSISTAGPCVHRGRWWDVPKAAPQRGSSRSPGHSACGSWIWS